MSTVQTPPNTEQPPRRRRAVWIVVAVIAAGLTGAAVTSAFSRGPGFHGFGPGSWHHHGFMGRMGGAFDPDRAERMADRMIRHLAIELDASNDQQEKLRAVVRGAVKDIIPMREKAQAARVRARQLLTQQDLDRAEIEKFRAEQMSLAEAFSKRAAQALGDAAEILTPEQRRKLEEHLPARGGPGPGWNR
jgi:Spy/CpxP family protein refolding chaperone